MNEKTSITHLGIRSMPMKKLLQRAKQLEQEIISHRRYLHQHPEIGLEMPIAYEYVTTKLVEMGYSPERIGGYGVAALVGGVNPGKTYLIRADMDALPITEETGLSFAAENGCMHACGHDTHTAMLLGAARILKEVEDEIPGTVKIFFQTAEETLQGAREAIASGILENPNVDAAAMIHILSGRSLPSGSVAMPIAGACYASADWYHINVYGKGGHGAMSHTTISATNIICAINDGIQEIMSVVIPRFEYSSMTVGCIQAGYAPNIIPETASLSGTIRSFNEEVRAKIKSSLETMAEGVAKARGGTATVHYTNMTPATINDKAARDIVAAALRYALDENTVLDMAIYMDGKLGRTTGSEDFAYIAEKVPSTVLFLNAGTPEEGYKYYAHNSRTDFREDVLYIGAASYAIAALGWLAEQSE